MGRSYRPFPHPGNPSSPPTVATPPHRNSAARQKTPPHLRRLLKWPQKRGHPGHTQISNEVQESPISGNRLHPSSTPRARRHLSQQGGPLRCLHTNLGPPQGNPLSHLFSLKGHARIITTRRIPPFNTHGACVIRRLLLHQN